MISIITIILFFLYLWGLGYTATFYLKKPENALEKLILNLAVGLGIIPILTILLNFFHIILDWKIIFVLSLAFPLYQLILKIKNKQFPLPKLKLHKSDIPILIAVLFALFSLYMYTEGAFKYPYLEDEDPWGHAVGVKYVAIEKNAYDPPLQNVKETIDPVLAYIDPYPPAYDILLGILHQTSPDLNWTMKFFNALILSLGILFFYLLAKQFTQSTAKTLWATFILTLVPAYMSHFIWAHTLAITLFFPTLYAFHAIIEDKRWMIVAAVLLGSIWVSQNFEQPIKITTMIIVYIVITGIILRRFIKEHLFAVAGGIILSLSWWLVIIKKYTLQGFLDYFGGRVVNPGDTISISATSNVPAVLQVIISTWQTITNPTGSSARPYTFSDFFVASSENMINGPIGIGIVISLLTIIGLIYIFWKYKTRLVTEEKNLWRSIMLFWLIFTFWAINGLSFPISVARGPFRAWMLFAIPVALIAAEGIVFLQHFFSKSKYVRWGIALIIIVGVIFTAGVPKYKFNTVIWPTSGFFSGGVQEAYEYGAWFDIIPDNTNVFLYAPRDKIVIGFGKNSCDWCQDNINFRKNILDRDATELYTFLKEHHYEYIILSPREDIRYFKSQYENKTQDLLTQRYNEIIYSGLFTLVYQKEGSFVVFKLR